MQYSKIHNKYYSFFKNIFSLALKLAILFIHFISSGKTFHNLGPLKLKDFLKYSVRGLGSNKFPAEAYNHEYQQNE